MKTDNTYKFRISISREGYQDKNTARACLNSRDAKAIGREKMAFKQQEVSVKEFLDYAVKGHSFCNLFIFNPDKKYWIENGGFWTKTYPVYTKGANKGFFKLSFKQDMFFAGSQVVFVDIDYTHYEEIYDYIDALSYTPTCVYTSFSDNELKGGRISRRFRLVYVFDRVMDEQEFKSVSVNLYQQIIEDTDEPMDDLCGLGVSQYMNGTNGLETYMSNVIYSPEDIERIVITEKKENKNKKVRVSFNKEMLMDMQTLPYTKVVEKWWCKGMRYISKSEKQFTTYYSTDAEEYYSLYWHKDKVADGERRRMKLFMRAAVRRLMKADITPDELLYNLFIDRERFFDNSDKVLTLDVLKNKVKSAMRMDIEYIKTFKQEYRTTSFIISPDSNDKRRDIAAARRDIMDRRISQHYDENKSVKENLESLHSLGVKVSQTRLYQWVKIHINKKETVSYNPELSIRENMKRMNCTKYQVEKAKKEYEEKQVMFESMDEFFDSTEEGRQFLSCENYQYIDIKLRESIMDRFSGLDTGTLYQYYLRRRAA